MREDILERLNTYIDMTGPYEGHVVLDAYSEIIRLREELANTLNRVKERRAPKDIALEFVREQSSGEWDEKTINEDAEKLAEIIRKERI